MSEVLVIGGEQAGKSLSIRRIKEMLLAKQQLQPWDTTASSEATLPTVGVELHTISLSPEQSVNIREIGSALSSRWENYLSESSHIIFVIDASDFGNLASSMVLLHELLSNDTLLVNKPILVAINKLDLVDQQTLLMVNNFLRLDELRQNNNMTIVYGSCMDGSLCCIAVEWLKKHVH